MRSLPLILFLALAIPGVAHAQGKNHLIRNVRTTMTGRDVEIRYDLAGPRDGSPHTVDLAVVDNRRNVVYPDSVTGDLGAGIMPGEGKLITWEIYKEYDAVNGDFTPRLILDAGVTRNKGRGPEYAALSLLIPGLGDYFVADVKEMKIKPWYKTAFTAAFLGMSWAAFRNRDVIPPVMNPPGWYYTMHSPDPVYIDHEWLQVIEKTDYWLFPHDAEVFLGVGAAAWLLDVVWVARKGALNNRVRKGIPGQVSILPARQGFMLCYRQPL